MGTCTRSPTRTDLHFCRSLLQILDVVGSLYRMTSSPVEHWRDRSELQQCSVQILLWAAEYLNPFRRILTPSSPTSTLWSHRVSPLSVPSLTRQPVTRQPGGQSCSVALSDPRSAPATLTQPRLAPQSGHKLNSFFPITPENPQHPSSSSSRSTQQENTHTTKTLLPPRSWPKPLDHIKSQAHDRHFAS